jgi:hypothetical protein
MEARQQMINNIREYLVREMQAASTIEGFDLSETLLVMYDTGVISAESSADGDPKFLLNENATPAQHAFAEKMHDVIHNAPNDIWNNYVYGSAC